MDLCLFIDYRFNHAIIYVNESRLSIYDSCLREVYFYVQNSSSLTIASCRCLFTAHTDTFISVFDSSKVLVTDTELRGGNVLYGSANFDVKFTNCTFDFYEQLVETEGGTISIKYSRITDGLFFSVDKIPISLSEHSYLYLENTSITNNNQMHEGATFLIAEAKSYFKMTKCLYKMNDFTTHFSIKDDSTMEVVDSVISDNEYGVQILNIAGSTCFLEGTSLNYSKNNILGDLLPLVKLSVVKMVMAQCSVENVYLERVHTRKTSLFPGKHCIKCFYYKFNNHSNAWPIRFRNDEIGFFYQLCIHLFTSAK